MKIFQKKFLTQEVATDEPREIKVQGKSKINYLLNQLLIWGIIMVVIYFIIQFYDLNI